MRPADFRRCLLEPGAFHCVAFGIPGSALVTAPRDFGDALVGAGDLVGGLPRVDGYPAVAVVSTAEHKRRFIG